MLFEEFNPSMASSDETDELSMLVREAVKCLPDDKKAIIALFVAGFKQHEVSTILDVSRTTVWSKKKESLEELKLLLEGEIQCLELGNIGV